MVPAGERRDQRDTWHGFSNALVAGVRDGRDARALRAARPLASTTASAPGRCSPSSSRCSPWSASACAAYYTYKAQIERDEEGKPWLRRTRSPLVEREVALDIVKHGLMVAPLVVAGRGLDHAAGTASASAAIALGIVLRQLPRRGGDHDAAPRRVGPTAIGARRARRLRLRLAVILVALVLLRHQPWIDLPTLGFVIVGTHLGLLVWEMRYVSLTLAAPGLKPARPSGDQ